MRTGTVKFFNESKGYGFITDDETGKDIFVHATGIKTEGFLEGDKVFYEEENSRKGKITSASISNFDKERYLSLYFDLNEFNEKEISEIILNLSDVYTSIGGDTIVIKGIELLDFDMSLKPVLI